MCLVGVPSQVRQSAVSAGDYPLWRTWEGTPTKRFCL